MLCWKTVQITPVEREPLRSRLLKFIQVIYVLALVFFKLAADEAVNLVEKDLRVDRFCRLYGHFSVEECDLMEEGNFTYVKNATLGHEMEFDRTANIISIPVSLLVVVLTASWSDRHGRKPLLKLSIVGYFLSAFIYILFAALKDWPVEVLLAASILRSLAGGPSLFVMAIFSMMVDKTDLEDRSIRLGTLTNLIIIGHGTGYVAGLLVMEWSDDDPFWVIFLALLFYVIAMFITTCLLKEDPTDFETRVPPRCQSSCVDLIHPKNVSDLFGVTFRRRPHRNRLHLLMILWVTFFVLLSPPHLMTEWTTTFLEWTPLKYSIMSAIFVISCQVTTVVFLRATQKRPIQDCLLGTIAEGMTAVQDLLLIPITKPELSSIIYLSFMFSVSHNLGNVGIRAALSKLCEEGEIGRVFGIMAMQETIMSWAQDLVYQRLWDVTREILPTSQHILSASFAILNAGVLFIVFVSMKSTAKSVGENEDNSLKEMIKTIGEEKTRYQSTDEANHTKGHDNLALEMDN